jgi:hypothetical protein
MSAAKSLVTALAALAISPAPASSQDAHQGMDHAAHMQALAQQPPPASARPSSPGQDAFGAIQEITALLEAAPATDWSKVDLEALRQHLIDMDELTLKASISQHAIDGGIEARVTGEGRTVEAIRRMTTAHFSEIEATRLNGWSARVSVIPGGVLATITAADPREVLHLRGLGFIGVMASGANHTLHHLAMAKGEMSP